jgi:dihydropyrimidinase
MSNIGLEERMELDYIIKNGKFVIPREGVTAGCIGIKDEKIMMISKNLDFMASKEVIEAKGKYVFPGIIEPHVHFGLGSKLDEDFLTETRSAATGGVSTVITYYRQIEPYEKIFDEIKRLGEERSCIDFSIHLGISSEEHIRSIPKYIDDFGVTSFKFLMAYKGEDAKKMGSAEMTDGLLYDALLILKERRGALPCVHAENIELIWNIRRRLMDQGRSDPAAWSDSRPDFTESEYVRRALFLAELTGCPIYIVHLGSKKALEEVRSFRKHYSKVFIETCPPYLTHTKESMTDNLLKIAPPVHSREDNDALWDGIKDGSIQTVGSDHLALKRKGKEGSIWDASMGISGVATLLPVLLSEGFHKRGIPLERIAEVTSYNAAKIFNLYPQKGSIQIGSDADLTIVDLEKEKTVTHNMLNSSSDFSIYENWHLKGWPILTMVRGNVVMKDGEVVGKKGFGKYIRRNPV